MNLSNILPFPVRCAPIAQSDILKAHFEALLSRNQDFPLDQRNPLERALASLVDTDDGVEPATIDAYCEPVLSDRRRIFAKLLLALVAAYGDLYEADPSAFVAQNDVPGQRAFASHTCQLADAMEEIEIWLKRNQPSVVNACVTGGPF